MKGMNGNFSWSLIVLSGAVALALTACAPQADSGESKTETAASTEGSTPPAKIKNEVKEGEMFANMETSKGLIRIKLYPDVAPITVANFVNLAQRKYYDDLTFHRVIPNFMIQGGDPDGTGRGGPGYNFEDEFDSSVGFTRPGLLAMANSGPGTNGSQFFITHVPTPHLNNKHTIFGEVVDDGQDIVNKVQGGDKMITVQIEGDTSALLESNKTHVDKWNKILDAQ